MKDRDSAETPGRHHRGHHREYHRRPDHERHDEHHEPWRGEGTTDGDVVFGVGPVCELILAAPDFVRVFYMRAGDEKRFAAEAERVRKAGGRTAHIDERELARLCGRGARHQGVAALVREYQYVPFESVLENRPDPTLVIDGVTDPRNLGAILRSAEGAGVATVVLARDRTVGMTAAAVKSSAGAWIHMKIARCGNVARTLEQLKQAGYWIVALAPGGGLSLYDLDVSRPLAIVVGSEGRGVREIVKKTADFIVDIPMRGKIASLNVSVATAVALFEIARQRARGSRGGVGRDGGRN